MEVSKELRIYLQDHAAGALAGRELVRRIASSNDGNEYGRYFSELAREVEEDRQDLQALMKRLGVGSNTLKEVAAWTGEKAGRAKLNGQLTGYSPLSRLEEIEFVTLGVHGKLALWRSLSEALSEDVLEGIDLRRLAERAEAQLRELEGHRLRAAAEALTGSPRSPG